MKSQPYSSYLANKETVGFFYCHDDRLTDVVMATSDKHCQTSNAKADKIDNTTSIPNEFLQSILMYDETVNVLNAREIDSPDSEDQELPVKAAMSKFNPPARRTARHNFDSESETDSDPEKLMSNISGEDQSPDRKLFEKTEKPKEIQKHTKDGKSKSKSKVIDSSENSDTDSNDVEADKVQFPLAGIGHKRSTNVVIPVEGAYDPKQFQDLKVPPEMDNIFQYIMKYTPQKIEIAPRLQPFVPEYVPAVGDIDAFIKVTTPACNVRSQPLDDSVLEFIDNLGLSVLDEPASEQSESALLHLQLRALTKSNTAASTVVTKKIENAEKSSKAIERWIKDVSELHLSKPAPNFTYSTKLPDIDSLMEEWPDSMEQTLNDVGVPSASLDCSLVEYVDIICGLFDIPIVADTLSDRIQALHVLFSLYFAVKNSQLYADREKDEKSM